MNLFESETIVNTPRALEVINNLTEEENKKLRFMTIKYMVIIVVGFILLTVLFILFVRSLPVSITVKWLFAISHLIVGFLAARFISYLLIKKQKMFLETTQYACHNNIKLFF